MEKQEKIQQSKQQTVRWVMGSIFITCCVTLLWTLLSMEDAGPVSSTTSGQEDQRLRKNPMIVSPSAHEKKAHNHPHQHHRHEHLAKQQPDDGKDEERRVDAEAAAQAPPDDVKAPPAKPSPEAEEEALVQRVYALDQEVRQIKAQPGVLMEVDEKGVAASKRLQEATRALLAQRYGPHEPYRVKVDLKFQASNPTTETLGEFDSFVIELAPSSLQPHSIFSFLEIARHWQGGAFHRRANHVLQAMVQSNAVPHLAFQEYSKEYPHKRGTVGYAGRPSGPGWYVSIQDNTNNHGPGSQQSHNPYEADSCFGKVVQGFDEVILGRVTKMPGDGFLKPPLHVLMERLTILVPNGSDDEYVEWKPLGPILEFPKQSKR